MANNDPAQIVLGKFQVVANSVDVGYTEDVSVDFKPTLKDKITAQTLSQKLGVILTGVEHKISTTLLEVPKASLALAFPWYGGSGAITLVPTILGVDLYDYAIPLVLHPMEKSDASMDWNFTKAVVIGGGIKRDGKELCTLKLEWMLLPDRAQLPLIKIGTFGT